MPATVLTSWKEVAAHLRKGVRTVQRWERELGLPVRRPEGAGKHIVVAFPEELDNWLHTRLSVKHNGNNRREGHDGAVKSRTLELRNRAEEQLTLMTRLIADLRRSVDEQSRLRRQLAAQVRKRHL